jgi:HlyD family secretion protein
VTPRPLSQILVLTLAAALSLSACAKKEPPKETPAERARAVRVVRVEPRSIVGSLTASGQLTPREEATVVSEVSGYRVAKVLADVGDYVSQGQTLVQLDGALIAAQIQQQRAAAAQALVQAEQAESQAARVSGLDGQGVLSQEQLDTRRFQARAARATANAQAAALKDVQTRADKLAVTAPVEGLVLERNVRPGDLSGNSGTTPWFRIAEKGQVELEAELSEDDLSRVKPGQRALVTLPSGGEAVGAVRLISPQISTSTKLGSVRIILPVRADIRSGGFGRAVFADAAGKALAVPETAVRYDADGASVMVVGADNKVKQVPIQAGARGGGLVVLIKGPPAGARVVQSAAAFLLDGDLVRPVEDPAPAAKPATAKPATAKP